MFRILSLNGVRLELLRSGLLIVDHVILGLGDVRLCLDIGAHSGGGEPLAERLAVRKMGKMWAWVKSSGRR